MTSAATTISVRHCAGHADYLGCMDLQRAVWNFGVIDVVSHHVLVVAAETGGQVLGAFDGDRMVGFVLAFAATRGGEVHLHSHMLAVLPEFQGRGTGRLLKMAQRDDALARGISLIEWTFDPLQTRNASFNFARLGAIARRYLPDFYGSSSSPLHANLQTDRLLAEWWLTSPRVQAHLAGTTAAGAADGPVISVPRNMDELRQNQPARAAEIQARVRREFSEMFARGYAATGIAMTDTQGNYQLERIP